MLFVCPSGDFVVVSETTCCWCDGSSGLKNKDSMAWAWFSRSVLRKEEVGCVFTCIIALVVKSMYLLPL